MSAVRPPSGSERGAHSDTTVQPRITRNMVVQRWGTPQVTVGSVNEPREMQDHGVRYNEKWLYRGSHDAPGRTRDRVIFWNRYNFVAAFTLASDGTWEPDDPNQLLADLESRSYTPQDARR